MKRLVCLAMAGLLFSTGLNAVRAANATDSLDLGAMVQPVPLDSKFAQPGYFVWCGAPVRGTDGKHHLFYSRWPVKKGFHPGWAIHSEIAYAVSDQPFGPYQFVNVALSARGTNAATGRKYWDADMTHNPNGDDAREKSILMAILPHLYRALRQCVTNSSNPCARSMTKPPRFATVPPYRTGTG